MKKLLVLFHLLVYVNAYTQLASFQMQRVNYCTNETAIDSNRYYLVNKAGVSYKNEQGTVWLPATGKYEIYYPGQPDVLFPTINIKNETNIYIHKDSKIRVSMRFTNGITYVYTDCNGLLNGEHEDYYEDGTVKMRGNFKKGIPRDSITIFYRNGSPYRSIIYLPKSLYIKEFDSLSRVVMISHSAPENSGNSNYNTTTFYPNGNIQTNQKFKKGILFFTAYYEGRRLKIETDQYSRKEYTIDGNIATIYKWKEKKSGKSPPYGTKFELVKTSYDASGRRTEEIRYHTISANRQPPTGLGSAIYFVYWKKFDANGVEQLVLENKAKYEVMTNSMAPINTVN